MKVYHGSDMLIDSIDLSKIQAFLQNHGMKYSRFY